MSANIDKEQIIEAIREQTMNGYCLLSAGYYS